jgi:hypothetical protein
LWAGIYRLGPVRRFNRGDETIEVWSALDALVLKTIALVLTAHWLPNFSEHCHHLPGRGEGRSPSPWRLDRAAPVCSNSYLVD